MRNRCVAKDKSMPTAPSLTHGEQVWNDARMRQGIRSATPTHLGSSRTRTSPQSLNRCSARLRSLPLKIANLIPAWALRHHRDASTASIRLISRTGGLEVNLKSV